MSQGTETVQRESGRKPLPGIVKAVYFLLLLYLFFFSIDLMSAAFKMAGRKAFREAAAKCKATLLEPIMQIEVYVPEDNLGDVMGDLNSRRGRVQGMDSEDGTTTVKAQVPLAEMFGYSTDLRSSTQGRATFTMQFSHFDSI